MRAPLPAATLILLAACSSATVATSQSRHAAPATVASHGASCPVAPIPSDLAPTRNAYIAAWEGTDAEAVARFFVDDAVVRTDDQTMTGRVAITSGWISEHIGKLSDLRFASHSLSHSGADVTERGVMTLKFRHNDGRVTDERGSYTHVWTRHRNGTWRLREARLSRRIPTGC